MKGFLQEDTGGSKTSSDLRYVNYIQLHPPYLTSSEVWTKFIPSSGGDLMTGENHRRAGKAYAEAGDRKSAFVMLVSHKLAT